MDRSKKVIILLVTGFLIITIIIVSFVLWNRVQDKNLQDENSPVEKMDVSKDQENAVKLPKPTAQEINSGQVTSLAKTFTERFGTFTSQSDFQSIETLKPMMSEEMVSWTENTYIPQLKRDHNPEGFFYKITANAPTAEIIESNEEIIKVKVTAQRQETKGDEVSEIFRQELIVEFKLFENNWLVNGAVWQSKM